MAAKEIGIRIRAKWLGRKAVKAARSGIKKVGQAAKKMGASVKNAFTGMAAKITASVAIMATAFIAIRTGIQAVKEAMKFESVRLQFAVLLGSMKKAEVQVRRLQDFSAATPFQFDDLAKGAKQLLVFSENALGTTDDLRRIGDAAAMAGMGFSEVAFWVGRAYAAIQGGQPFGEAAMRLGEMGILAPKTAVAMRELRDAGGSAADIFALLEGDMNRADGTMALLSQTGEGLASTVQDNWKLALADFGAVLLSLVKDRMKLLIDFLQRIRNDGSIEKWGIATKEVLQKVLTFLDSIPGRFREITAEVGTAIDKLKGWGAAIEGFFSGEGGLFSIGDRIEGGKLAKKLADERMASQRKLEKDLKGVTAAHGDPAADERAAADKTALEEARKLNDEIAAAKAKAAADAKKIAADTKKDAAEKAAAIENEIRLTRMQQDARAKVREEEKRGIEEELRAGRVREDALNKRAGLQIDDFIKNEKARGDAEQAGVDEQDEFDKLVKKEKKRGHKMSRKDRERLAAFRARQAVAGAAAVENQQNAALEAKLKKMQEKQAEDIRLSKIALQDLTKQLKPLLTARDS